MLPLLLPPLPPLPPLLPTSLGRRTAEEAAAQSGLPPPPSPRCRRQRRGQRAGRAAAAPESLLCVATRGCIVGKRGKFGALSVVSADASAGVVRRARQKDRRTSSFFLEGRRGETLALPPPPALLAQIRERRSAAREMGIPAPRGGGSKGRALRMNVHSRSIDLFGLLKESKRERALTGASSSSPLPAEGRARATLKAVIRMDPAALAPLPGARRAGGQRRGREGRGVFAERKQPLLLSF